MKFKTLFLVPFALSACLMGCNSSNSSSSKRTTFTVTWQNDDGTNLEVDENVNYGDQPSYDGATPKKDGYTFKGWSPELNPVTDDVTYVAQYEEIPFDTRIVGTWYVWTASYGVIPKNFSFQVLENRTLLLDKYTLTLKGNYAGFENTSLFYYGTIQFIVSYSEDPNNPGVDWGYINVNEQDMGFARATQYSKYEYNGDRFPNAEVKSYLGTSLDLIPYDNDYYYLDNFESALYECKSSDIEIRDTTFSKFKAYINLLISNGYVFNSFDENTARTDTFYIAYDATKTYSLRLIYFGEDNEAHIFAYKYMAKLHETK